MFTYETSGTLTTETRQADEKAVELTTTTSQPTNTSVSVSVHQDESGGTTADTTESVSVADGTTTNDLSAFSPSAGGTYWLTIELSTTDDTATPTVDEATLTVGALHLRFTQLSGDGELSATRTMSKARSSVLEGDGQLSNTRTVTKPRASTLTGEGSLTNSRTVAKSRTTTLEGDGELSNSTIFRETFASELTRDLAWDYVQAEQGFVSEWIDKYPAAGHGSVALYVDGRLDSPPVHVIVEVDTDGDGRADERSRVAAITTTDDVAVYPSLSGGEGRYRVIIRDLTPRDILAAVNFGTTHT